MVLVHGYLLDGHSWEKQEAALLAAGYRVITYDRRGFGSSSRPSTGYDYDTLAGDLSTLLDELDLHDVILAGFCAGAGEVTRYLGSRDRRRVRAAALLAPFLPPRAGGGAGGADRGALDELTRLIVADRPAATKAFLDRSCNIDLLGGTRVSDQAWQNSFHVAIGASAAAVLGCAAAWREDLSADLARITVPVLVVQAGQDRVMPPGSSPPGLRISHVTDTQAPPCSAGWYTHHKPEDSDRRHIYLHCTDRSVYYLYRTVYSIRSIMSTDSELQTQVALVTGATSGIGREVARRLAADGFFVLVHGRDATRGAAVVREITEAGGHARFTAADLTDVDAIGRLAEEAGGVDVLVNNAGFSWFGPTADLDPVTFDQMFAANVRSAYYLTAAIAPAMAKRGTGAIINLGSMAGQIGLPGGAAYSATKAALAALARSWAAEFSPHGVRVNTVAPGPAYTDGASPDRIAALGGTTLLARAAQPSEIADVVAFLASPKAGYITGAVIAADGGRTAV